MYFIWHAWGLFSHHIYTIKHFSTSTLCARRNWVENWEKAQLLQCLLSSCVKDITLYYNVLKFCILKFLIKWHMQTVQTSPDPSGAVRSGSTLFAIPLNILRNNYIKTKFRPKKYEQSVWNFKIFTIIKLNSRSLGISSRMHNSPENPELGTTSVDKQL